MAALVHTELRKHHCRLNSVLARRKGFIQPQDELDSVSVTSRVDSCVEAVTIRIFRMQLESFARFLHGSCTVLALSVHETIGARRFFDSLTD